MSAAEKADRQRAKELRQRLANYDLEVLERLVRMLEPPGNGVAIRSPQDAMAQVRPLLAGLTVEKLVVVYLDTRGRAMATETVSTGTQDHTLFDVRSLLRGALHHRAKGMIVAHNHPSGDPKPSSEDILVTRKLAEGCGVFGISLSDHIIYADPNRFVSLAERGLLQCTTPARRMTA